MIGIDVESTSIRRQFDDFDIDSIIISLGEGCRHEQRRNNIILYFFVIYDDVTRFSILNHYNILNHYIYQHSNLFSYAALGVGKSNEDPSSERVYFN